MSPDLADFIDRHHDRLRRQKQTLKIYLKAKIQVADWHAVSDAANDLREVDAKLKTLNLLRDKMELG